MLLEPSVVNEFMVGAAAGLGHSLGLRVLNWITSHWARSTRQKLAQAGPLLRRVELKDVRGRIPDGMQLCRYRGNQFVDASTTAPTQIAEGETLWLIPKGTVWLPTEFLRGTDCVQAEVAVEFDPSHGLYHLLDQGNGVTAAAVGALIAGGFLGVANSAGQRRWSELFAGDASATTQCLNQVNQTLAVHGVRCQGVRQLQVVALDPQQDGEVVTAQQELTESINSLKTPQDWQAVPQALAQSGLPLDATAETELRAMQDEVLRKQLSPEQAAARLAALTAAALERAGVRSSDLGGWRNAALQLEQAEPATPANPPASAVGSVQRPGTWWVWDRMEVDRRLQRYLRRLSQHGRTGLEQALLTVTDLPALRKLRELQTQMALLDELLATLPTAEPRTRGLRLDGVQVKEAVSALQTAVTQAEKLRGAIDTLVRTPIEQPAWTAAWSDCIQATTILIQHVRDRRLVR